MLLNIVLLFSLFVLFCWRDKRPNFFPPGPPWIPIIGNLYLIYELLQEQKFYFRVWNYLAERYGSVVGLKLGTKKLVIVSGKEMIKEFYSNEDFDGRPDGFFYRIRSFDKRLGIVFTDERDWEVQRKFTMKTLKQLGLGRTNMVEHIEREAYEMVEYFKERSKDGSPIEMHDGFDIPVLNVMWAFLSGSRFELDDERLPELTKMIHDSFRVIDMSGGLLNLWPSIRYFLPEKSGYKPLLRTLEPLWAFLQKTIDAAKPELDNPDAPRSFIGNYLEEMRSNTRDHTFTEEQLLALCVDLFQAGSETSSNTLGFGLIYVLHNPYVIDKMRKELDFVVGKERLPTLSDRTQLRYTEAVVCEILRLSTVAPLAIAHRALCTTRLGKYIIPKDSLAMVTLNTLHMDKDYWGDPEVFRPERFMNAEGNLIQHENFMPFGAGKRRCIGENLAKSSVFLFFASFIHSFDILPPSKRELPSLEPIDGITLSPQPYKVFLKSRKY
ncbi:methyl farnesoate epoxidase-like [Culicoides brevitarsis]|uniref:methyl farnesoate epoxidase-like n=1 Tax=Culicoides brevitarsis TaxID=469753 RepID=UPI00307C627D